MPLTPGNDPKTIAQNIKKELEKGVPYKQAVAIAMSKSGKPKPKN
jgi:ribosomal protein S3